MTTALADIAPGQCRLDFTSTTVLTLNRKNGRFMPMIISGTLSAKLIPAIAPTLSNSGVANSTRYYVYAYDVAGVFTLEYSTTAYVVDATYGFPVKSGDNSRTLVGLAVTTSGGLWQAQGKGTLSWYNRLRQIVRINNATYANHNSASYGEVDTALRATFVCWADEQALTWVNTSGGHNTSADDSWLALYLDGSTFLCEEYMGSGNLALFHRTGMHSSVPGGNDETSHYVTLMQKESATQFVGGNQSINKMNTVIEVCVMG